MLSPTRNNKSWEEGFILFFKPRCVGEMYNLSLPLNDFVSVCNAHCAYVEVCKCFTRERERERERERFN